MDSNNNTELYEILGVNKRSTPEEIKKRYKQLAMKHHPDRNPNNREESEERFKDITRAHDILSDPKKRDMYDKFGITNENEMPTQMSNPFGGLFSQKQVKITKKNHSVTLEEIYNEELIEVSINLNVMCLGCLGVGTKNKNDVIRCNDCNGQGQKIQIKMLAPGIITQSQQTCNICKGEGKRIRQNCECPECKGNKVVKQRKPFNVKLNNTMRNGHQITYKNEGNIDLKWKQKDDLIIQLNFATHPIFNISGNDLCLTYNISLIDSLCGLDFYIKYLDGSYIHAKENSVIEPYSKKCINGLGINKSGKMIIEFKVLFPKKLSDERKTYIRKLLESKYKNVKTVPKSFTDYTFNDYIDENKEKNGDNNEEHFNNGPIGCAQQ
jgi:DnaJ-class molecular chaperone